MSNLRNKLAAVLLLAFVASALAVAQTVIGPYTVLPSLQVQTAGTAGAPSYSWTVDPTTGFYRFGSSQIGFSGALIPGADAAYDLGSASNRIRNLYLSGTLTAPVSFTDGSAGAPSITFANQTTTGFYRPGSAQIGVSGTFLAGTDNTYDIGAVSATRFRNEYLSGLQTAGSYQVGTGAPTTSNVLLRSSDGTGLLSVLLGDGSGAADLWGRKVAFGNAADITFAASSIKNGMVANNYTGVNPATDIFNFYSYLNATPTVDVTHILDGIRVDANFRGTHNLSEWLEAVNGSAFWYSSGTAANVAGVSANATTQVGSGVVTNLYALDTYWTTNVNTTTAFGGYFGGEADAGTTATAYQVYIDSNNFGGGTITNVYGLYVANQTNASSTNAYGIVYAAPSSHQFFVKADGTTAVYGATPETAAPFKVGGAIASTRYNNGNSGTTQTVDWSKGNVQKSTLTGNVTYTFSNPSDSGIYFLEVFSGAGGFTATWPATVKWPAGTAPTITATASRMDLVRFVYDATSAEYWGYYASAQNYTP